MQQPVKTFTSQSGQLCFSVFTNPAYISGFMQNLSNVQEPEYLDYLGKLGDAMAEFSTGRFILDTSNMRGYSISLRAAAVTNVSKLLITKAPFFVLAMVKGSSLFENLGLQTALKMALPLSSKFLAGEMFDNTPEDREKALKWLIEFPVPIQFQV